MRSLFAALSRTFFRHQLPTNALSSAGVLPATEGNGVFSLGFPPQEGRVVPYLTLSWSAGCDPAQVEELCRIHGIRFAEEAEPAPLEPVHGKLDGKIHF